jgi:hypothetical protein
VYAGINSYHRSQAWGEWLCVTHTVGDRFEIQNPSRSKNYNYDLVLFEVNPEDAQRLADTNLANPPSALNNSTWQPQKRHSDIESNQAPLAPVSDLEIGDINFLLIKKLVLKMTLMNLVMILSKFLKIYCV